MLVMGIFCVGRPPCGNRSLVVFGLTRPTLPCHDTQKGRTLVTGDSRDNVWDIRTLT